MLKNTHATYLWKAKKKKRSNGFFVILWEKAKEKGV